MSQRIHRIEPLSAAKIVGAVYLVIGVAMIPFFLLAAALGDDSPWPFPAGFALTMPVFYAVLGFLGAAVFSWLYNVLATRLGGIEIELTSEPQGPPPA